MLRIIHLVIEAAHSPVTILTGIPAEWPRNDKMTLETLIAFADFRRGGASGAFD